VLLLVGGFFILIRNLRRRPATEPTLTAEEQERAARLLAGDNGKTNQ
jgi:cytochrome c-type biogenesis protein CcmH/NrfF